MNSADPLNTNQTDKSPGDRPLWKESKPPFQFSIRRLCLLTLVVCVALGCIVNLPAILLWAYRQWEVGERFDQRIFENPHFKLRVTAFHQRGAIFGAPGGFYQYEVKTASDWWWRGIVMFRLPTPEPIPVDQVRQIAGPCAYFFQGCVFGVTTDGGKSWLVQGGVDHPPIFRRQTDPNANIEMVSIAQDGVGTMRLSNFDYTLWKPLPSQRLVTSDFGTTWTEP